MKFSTLKPGLLVSLKTSVVGAVNYQRRDLEAEHTNSRGEAVARWETLRIIPDQADFELAKKARSKARSLISSVCCVSSFGLLCPNAAEADLTAAIEEARKITEAHNLASARSRVEVFVLVGRVADDDIEAARAIGAEVRELLDAMQDSIRSADTEAIRQAASRARALGGMLSENVAGKVSDAIAEARKAAREIVKRVEKEGEQAAVVIAELSMKNIEAARFAFLDLESQAAAAAPSAAPRAVEVRPLDDEAAPAQAVEQAAPQPLEIS